MKLVVKRTKENYKEVNDFFNSLFPNKTYSDTGTKGIPGSSYYRECDYLHYPADENNRTQSPLYFQFNLLNL